MQDSATHPIFRPEELQDRAGIYSVETAAFGRTQEADLVENLRAAGVRLISLVAEIEREIIAHLLFSPVEIRNETAVIPAMALGPVAVLPAWQRQGVGTRLIRYGLGHCRQAGHSLLFVLGHPTYYPRFGFQPTVDFNIRCQFDVPADVFMFLALREEGAPSMPSGTVYYHPLFSAI